MTSVINSLRPLQAICYQHKTWWPISCLPCFGVCQDLRLSTHSDNTNYEDITDHWQTPVADFSSRKELLHYLSPIQIMNKDILQANIIRKNLIVINNRASHYVKAHSIWLSHLQWFNIVLVLYNIRSHFTIHIMRYSKKTLIWPQYYAFHW